MEVGDFRESETTEAAVAMDIESSERFDSVDGEYGALGKLSEKARRFTTPRPSICTGTCGKRMNAVLFAVAVGLVLAAKLILAQPFTLKQPELASLFIFAESDYITAFGPIGIDYPWAKHGEVVVVDVGKPFTLVAGGAREECEYTWVIETSGSRVGSTWQGLFFAVGTYTASVSEKCPGSTYFGADTQTFVSGIIVVHWVRRELRELTAEDLGKVMDVMAVCYNTSTAEGKMKYGENFEGIDTFQLWHHLNSAQRDADHFHQGVGFVAQHAKITRYFEMSMQAVDPTVALPFWDPTIDSAQVASGELESPWKSPLWSPDMFGSIGRFVGDTFDTSDGHATTRALFGGKALEGQFDDATMREWAIQDGRFAFAKLPVRDPSTLPLGTPLNAYGLLRAPWNNNPSPYVSRYTDRLFNELPTCAELRVFALDDKGGWSATSWMYGASNTPHANEHVGLGNQIKLHSNDETFSAVVGSWDVKQHELWRLRRLDFPTDCTAAGPSNCRATCNVDMWGLPDVGYEIVKSQKFLPSEEDMASWKSDPAFMEKVAAAYCSNMEVSISGDSKDSGGCTDPSFWPIHGALERLYQYRILKGPGFRTDPASEWPEKNTCFGARAVGVDPDHLCYLAEAYDDPKTGMPTEGDFEGCCGGHHAGSRIYAEYPRGVSSRRSLMMFNDDGPFARDDESGNIEGSVGPTNEEMMELMNPLQGPYFKYPIYHHFRWEHCNAIGEIFP